MVFVRISLGLVRSGRKRPRSVVALPSSSTLPPSIVSYYHHDFSTSTAPTPSSTTGSTSSTTTITPHPLKSGPVHVKIPPGDDKPRLVCDDCGYIAYKNPLIVNGTVVLAPGPSIVNLSTFIQEYYQLSAKENTTLVPLPEEIPWVLLGRRDIEPRRGYYGLPAGFMECGETLYEGARREVYEEMLASVSLKKLIGVYSIPRISQVHMWYIGRLLQGGRNVSDALSMDNAPKEATETDVTNMVLGRNGANISCSPFSRSSKQNNTHSTLTKLYGAGSETQDALMFPLLPPEWCSTHTRISSNDTANTHSSSSLLPGRINILGTVYGSSGTTVSSTPLLPWDQLAFPSNEHILTTVSNMYWGLANNSSSVTSSNISTTTSTAPTATTSTVTKRIPRPMKNLQELFTHLMVEERVIQAIPNWERKS